MSHVYHDLMKQIEHLDSHHWLYLLVVVGVAGWFCLRGFGSRSGY